MQKVQFKCDSCGAEGLIRLSDLFDEYDISFCPSCAGPLPIDDEDELDYGEDD